MAVVRSPKLGGWYLGDQQRSARVDGDDLVERVRRYVHEVFQHADAGVVHQDVQAAARPIHALQAKSAGGGEQRDQTLFNRNIDG